MSLQNRGIPTKSDLLDHGLEAPAISISVTEKNGNMFTIHFGNVTQDERYHMIQMNDEPGIYLIDAQIFPNVFVDIDTLTLKQKFEGTGEIYCDKPQIDLLNHMVYFEQKETNKQTGQQITKTFQLKRNQILNGLESKTKHKRKTVTIYGHVDYRYSPALLTIKRFSTHNKVTEE